MAKKILTIGGAVRDLFLEYANPLTFANKGHNYIAFEEGRKLEVSNLLAYVGGGAANAAVSFKRLNYDAQAFFKVGNDPDGDYIVHTLQTQGISINHVVSDTVATGISCIVPTPSGNRTVLVYRGAAATLQENEIPSAAIEQVDQIYVTSLSGVSASCLMPVVMHAKKQKKIVAVNPGGSQLRSGVELLCAALPYIDIFILNMVEAEQLMRGLVQSGAKAPLSVSAYCSAVMSKGPHTVVVTDGATGVHVAHENTLYFYPALPVKVVSSVGAGDAFGSTFVALRAQGKSIEDALIGGIINASQVISHVGSQTGLMTLADLEKELAHADRTSLQTHTLSAIQKEERQT